MKRKFSLVMSAAMILSLIAPMTNALAEDIQTPETATPETVVTEDAASGGTTYYVDSTIPNIKTQKVNQILSIQHIVA